MLRVFAAIVHWKLSGLLKPTSAILQVSDKD